MFCSKCGSEVPNGATFCGTCGAEMVGAATMPVAAVTADQTAVMPAADGGYQQGVPGDPGNQGWQPQEEPPKKSKKGKVIAIIIAVLVLVGAGAGVAWYFTNQFYQDKLAAEASESAANGPQADQVSVDASESSSSTSSSSSSLSSTSSTGSSSSSSGPSDTADSSADADAYVGTWTGELASTNTYGKYNCYGATGNPMELTIKGNESTGQITADAKVLLHAHAMNEMTSDVDKHDADKMIELKDLVGTFDKGDFSFTRDIAGDYPDGNLLMNVSTSDKNGERILICEVKRSGTYGSDVITDTYELHKKKA